MRFAMLHNKNSYCSLSNGLISLDSSRLPSSSSTWRRRLTCLRV